MAWRLNKSVIRGELDNRQHGMVTGRIWLLGRPEPLELRLSGNALRDVAGARLVFENPRPEPGEPAQLLTRQEGLVGDITAARRFRVASSGPGASRWGQGLYLEWFSDVNGRVVIESADYRLQVTGREWSLTPAEEQQQIRDNRQAVCDWLDELNSMGHLEEGEELDREEERPPWAATEETEDEILDEFQWEKFLKESDERAEKFAELFERYKDEPDGERRVAREMGWTWLEEMLEAEERGLAPEIEPAVLENPPPLEPNPLTEGVDWVRSEHDHIEHPLVQRARRLAIRMWRETEAAGWMKENSPQAIRDLVMQTQMASVRLAGALNHLAYDDQPDNGFLVASLKRGLNVLHQALAAASSRAVADAFPPALVEGYRRELFDLRQDILAHMQTFRSRI